MKASSGRKRVRGIVAALIALKAAAWCGILWALPSSLGEVNLMSVFPRIMTPNGDGYNDVTFFKFDLPITGLPMETAIYDINGAKIAEMKSGPDDSTLEWNGYDSDGRVVPAGVYIYSIKSGVNAVTGTVVVAR
jgi:gliding motility-associated-like protein